MTETKELTNQIIEGIHEKKGHYIVKIDLRGIENILCDFFIICHGDSNTHVKAVYESVEKSVKQNTGERPMSREGLENGQWVLLDYSDVVVHIFQQPVREFYRLEELWADAKIEEVE